MEQKSILLVEDNPDDVELTIEALKSNKIPNEVTIARDGEEADRLLMESEFNNLPVLILLDLKLPKINGTQLLKKIRNHPKTKLLPVVILTSSDEEKDLIQSYENGANSYIRKPVDFQEFTNAVKNLGLYWLILNEAPPSKR